MAELSKQERADLDRGISLALMNIYRVKDLIAQIPDPAQRDRASQALARCHEEMQQVQQAINWK